MAQYRRPTICLVFIIILTATLTGCGSYENIKTPQPVPASLQAAPFSVMTFNIRLGLGQEDPEGKIHLMPWGRIRTAANEAIRAESPDIVGPQEVAGITQLQTIAHALDMNYAFEWHQTSSSRLPWWGVGILSKFPITASRGAEISTGPGNTRSILITTIDSGAGAIAADSVHKDKDLKDGVSVLKILDETAIEQKPVLLIGDFNITPNDPRLAPVMAKYIDTAMAVKNEKAKEVLKRGTFYPAKKRIDYVFAEKQYFTVLDAYLGAKEHRTASDHIAYITRLTLKKSSQSYPPTLDGERRRAE